MGICLPLSSLVVSDWPSQFSVAWPSSENRTQPKPRDGGETVARRQSDAARLEAPPLAHAATGAERQEGRQEDRREDGVVAGGRWP